MRTVRDAGEKGRNPAEINGFARWAGAVAMIVLAGCAADPARSAAAKAQAQQTYDACLASAARFADDGKTAPADMALAVAPMCYRQHLALEHAEAADMGSSERRKFEYTADDAQLGAAIAAIRAERTGRQLARAATP